MSQAVGQFFCIGLHGLPQTFVLPVVLVRICPMPNSTSPMPMRQIRKQSPMEGYIGKQLAPLAPLAPNRVQRVQAVRPFFCFAFLYAHAKAHYNNSKISRVCNNPYTLQSFETSPTMDSPPSDRRGCKCPSSFSHLSFVLYHLAKRQSGGPGGRNIRSGKIFGLSDSLFC